MSKTLLNNISKIDSGKSFRQRIDDIPNGGCDVIQMKDIFHEDLTISATPQTILLDDVSQHQLLQKGDILFMAKGNNNFAVIYNSDKPAVAVSLFFIIRPNRNKVIPEYLAWFLNAPTAQAYFHENRLGASVGNIRKEALETLEVELPSMDRQQQIAKLNQLFYKEKQITQNYLHKKELLLNGIMNNLILEK
ncbi:MAG: restriction endonuclease subunit S [Vicingaceae bacterium]|nr:restriction endonuclease subunit S [Vicingaceae bacterium]